VSNPSNTVTVVVPHGPAAPSNFTGTASAWIGPFGRVDLSWTDNSNNETGFVIEVSTSPTFQNATRLTAPANSTTLSQNFLWRGTSYYYRIRAENDYDESAWENLDIFPIVIP
nr:fibronectin type III domain-containing protein [Planctomycetota bacterium]